MALNNGAKWWQLQSALVADMVYKEKGPVNVVDQGQRRKKPRARSTSLVS